MPIVGINSFATAKSLVDKVVTVSEENIALAILRIVEKEKLVVEGASAVGLAAVLSGQLDEFKGKKVVSVMTGGNIQTTSLGRVLEMGMVTDGRLNRFLVTISDRAGGLFDLCNLLSKCGARYGL